MGTTLYALWYEDGPTVFRLYKSTDFGDSWSSIGGDLTEASANPPGWGGLADGRDPLSVVDTDDLFLIAGTEVYHWTLAGGYVKHPEIGLAGTPRCIAMASGASDGWVALENASSRVELWRYNTSSGVFALHTTLPAGYTDANAMLLESGSSVWLVGEKTTAPSGYVYKFDGTSWSQVHTVAVAAAGQGLTAIDKLADGTIVVGGSDQAEVYDGTTWTALASNTAYGDIRTPIVGRSANLFWSHGANNTDNVLKYDSGAWSATAVVSGTGRQAFRHPCHGLTAGDYQFLCGGGLWDSGVSFHACLYRSSGTADPDTLAMNGIPLGSGWYCYVLALASYSPTRPYVSVPTAGLYVDASSDEAAAADMLLINAVPQDGETGVSTDTSIRLKIVSILNEAISSATISVQSQANGTLQTAYDLTIGFGAGFSGSGGLQASLGSGVNDELELVIQPAAPFDSEDVITVFYEAETASGSLAGFYTFTIEDATAAGIESVKWITPRQVLVKFNEPVSQLTTPGGARFIYHTQGHIEIQAPDTLVLVGSEPLASWVGSYASVGMSYYPGNNKARRIISVDPTAKTVTVDTLEHGALTDDDGVDTQDDGQVVRTRNISASISPYRFVFDSTAEYAASGGGDDNSLTVQCGFEPNIKEIWPVEAAEIPPTDSTAQYVILSLEDDISFGRIYQLQARLIEDAVGNAADAMSLSFTTPMFGVSPDDLGFWSDGLVALTDKVYDSVNDHGLRRIAVVLQDLYNSVQYRILQLRHLKSADLCPDHYVPFLLDSLGNPFTFPLNSVAEQRKLADALPELKYGIGVASAIESIILTVTGVIVHVQPFVDGAWWLIGDDTRGHLGVTTVLGPGTEYGANSYSIRSEEDLTDEQRRIIREIAEWADNAGMHLVTIDEPSSGTTPVAATYWRIGSSRLGVGTILGT